MYDNDYRNTDPNRFSASYLDRDDIGTDSPRAYYGLGALLVICAIAAAFIFSGRNTNEQLARAPDSAPQTTMTAPATPGLPSAAAPGAAPLRATPRAAPQE
jgi:hypothetical protein